MSKYPFAFAVVAGVSSACLAQSELVRHDFNLSFLYDDGAGSSSTIDLRMSNTRSVVFEETDLGPGPVSNPVYEDTGLGGENPLFESSAAPGGSGWIAGIAIGVVSVRHLHPEGVIHRDIAARSFAVDTGTGRFELEADRIDTVLFRATTEDERATPLRWSVFGSFQLRAADGATLTLLDGSYIDATIVPAPATGVVLGVAALCATRRRRTV